VTGGSQEATGTPQLPGVPSDATPAATDPIEAPDPTLIAAPEGGRVDGTRFAHASEAEMARILDFYAVRWEYEPTTFPILWNLDGEVVESFAPDFYLPELEMFLEMTTLRQRLVRKKNRKLRRLRELYPDIRIKLFYARDFRAMMLKYGRLALAHALSGTPGQVVPERAQPGAGAPAVEPPIEFEPIADVAPVAAVEPVAATEPPIAPPVVRASPRTHTGRRRRRPRRAAEAGAEQETGA
jgi:hypoxanthine phosphoribosyltransferase